MRTKSGVSQFLEQLKAELLDAQKRQQEVGARLQLTNAEYQAVSQEVNSYLKIVEVQTRKELGPNAPPALPQPVVRTVVVSTPTAATVGAVEETNKTEMVRELLRQHPNGMTGKELWASVKDKFPHRQYVYSVLKRLKKKGDVVQKRKKFVFIARTEGLPQQASVQ